MVIHWYGNAPCERKQQTTSKAQKVIQKPAQGQKHCLQTTNNTRTTRVRAHTHTHTHTHTTNNRIIVSNLRLESSATTHSRLTWQVGGVYAVREEVPGLR